MTEVIKVISLTLVPSCTSPVKSCSSVKISDFCFSEGIELGDMGERLLSDHVYDESFTRSKRNAGRIDITGDGD